MSSEDTKKLRVTFHGGTGEVTGANFLIEGPLDVDESKQKRFLIDCGLSQSSSSADEINWEQFPYDPKTIDALFITHAHIDHIGRIPKLIHEGFNGTIYSTIPTKDISEIMLHDTLNILKRDKKHNLDKIYTKENVDKAMSLWHGLSYNKILVLNGEHHDGFGIEFKDSGHILGSAMIEIKYRNKKIVFTGDLGNSPSPILPDTEVINDANYYVMESVYGNRNHEGKDERKKMLEDVLEDNYKKKGVLMIPTFSLERSQELLFEMNELVENQRIPRMPIFFDSPLAIKLTRVFKNNQEYFNKKTQYVISSGDDIFHFPGLKETLHTEESKEILNEPSPKVIIAGSGMSSGGRVIHHEKNYLPDPKNTLLLIGYQSLGTLGRSLEDGAKSVRIFREEVPVKAKIVSIKGYSGHKDSDALVDFVHDSAETLEKVFCVMGEPKASMFLAQKIRDYLGINAYAPERGENVELEF